MKQYKEELVEEYGKADLTKRLHMFLEYPELRLNFTQIDDLEFKQNTDDNKDTHVRRKHRSGSVLFRPVKEVWRKLTNFGSIKDFQHT